MKFGKGIKKVPGNDNTYDWDIGSVFFVTQPFLFEKNKMDLKVPDMTAIYLSISNSHFETAKTILNSIDKKKEKGFIHLDIDAFDYFECITVSIVFAISALEVFFNQFLLGKDKNAILFTQTINKDGDKNELKRDDIEWLSLEEKLFEIMPTIFQIEKEKIRTIKSNFSSLNRIRNNIIHLKSSDLEAHTDIKRNSIWKRLFEQSKVNPAIISKDIMKFFYQESGIELPRSLRLLPFK